MHSLVVAQIAPGGRFVAVADGIDVEVAVEGVEEVEDFGPLQNP